MSELLSRIPNGVRYYSAADARVRRNIEEIAMAVFAGWSYEEIITPTVDYYSLFECGMGNLEAGRAFRFPDSDGSLLALRPDVTSEIARAAATLFARRDRPLRLCYAANVFRQRTQSPADWRRESTQLGCELLGRNSVAADMEMLIIAIEVLKSLGLASHFVITLNDVGVFNGVVDNLELDPDGCDELRRLVDIRAVADLQKFLAAGASDDESLAFANLIQLSGKSEIFDAARSVILNTRSREALARLERLWHIIESLDLSDHFAVDLGDVAKLDYYTGLTFKIFVEGSGARVGSGGRYDNLTVGFGKAEPAVGFVLELDALADLLANQRLENSTEKRDPARVEVENDDAVSLFREALERRAANECVMVKLSGTRL
jgi:ATP phosphoribosyltransferase regulatory subunit